MTSVKVAFSLSILSVALSGCFGGGGKSQSPPPAYQAPPQQQEQQSVSAPSIVPLVDMKDPASSEVLEQRLHDHWVTYVHTDIGNYSITNPWKKTLRVQAKEGYDNVVCRLKKSELNETGPWWDFANVAELGLTRCPFASSGRYDRYFVQDVNMRNKHLYLVNAKWKDVSDSNNSRFILELPGDIIPYQKNDHGEYYYICRTTSTPSIPLKQLAKTPFGYGCSEETTSNLSKYKVRYIVGGHWVPSKNYVLNYNESKDFTEAEYPQGFSEGQTFPIDIEKNEGDKAFFCRNSKKIVNDEVNNLQSCNMNTNKAPFEVLMDAHWVEHSAYGHFIVGELEESPMIIADPSNDKSSVQQAMLKDFTQPYSSQGGEAIDLTQSGLCEVINSYALKTRGFLVKRPLGWECVVHPRAGANFSTSYSVAVVNDASPKE